VLHNLRIDEEVATFENASGAAAVFEIDKQILHNYEVGQQLHRNLAYQAVGVEESVTGTSLWEWPQFVALAILSVLFWC
jgi:hypothetical protein